MFLCVYKIKKGRKKCIIIIHTRWVCKIGSYPGIYMFISGYDYLVINNVCECTCIIILIYIIYNYIKRQLCGLKRVFVFILERRVLPVLFVFVCCCVVCNNLYFFYN